MKAKSIYEFTRKVMACLTIATVVSGLCAGIAILVSHPFNTIMEAGRFSLVAVCIFLVFLVAWAFCGSILWPAQNFEQKINQKKERISWQKKNIEKLDRLLNKNPMELKEAYINAANVKIYFELEGYGASISIRPCDADITPYQIRLLLETEKSKLVKALGEMEVSFPRKSKTYAFLEKRLYLNHVAV